MQIVSAPRESVNHPNRSWSKWEVMRPNRIYHTAQFCINAAMRRDAVMRITTRASRFARRMSPYPLWWVLYWNQHWLLVFFANYLSGFHLIRSNWAAYYQFDLLHFAFIQVQQRGRPTFVEFVTFENHTECKCVRRAQTNVNNDEPVTVQTIVNDRCRCPKHFENGPGAQCKCDCLSANLNDVCHKLKAGLEHFSIVERK